MIKAKFCRFRSRLVKRFFLTILLIQFISLNDGSAVPTDSLFQIFQNPPESAKPRTWWHWTGGNVTHDGITKDLEWMQRVGIGGFQLADVAFGSGQVVEDKILFGSPEWLDAVRHAAKEASRLNLEMALFSSAGWSLTGGPWVTPEQAMKKLVWSDTLIHGSQSFNGNLPHPPFNNSPIQNLGRSRPGQTPDPTFYNDIAVFAYRIPKDIAEMLGPAPIVTTHNGEIDATSLFDGDLNSSITLTAPPKGDPAWIQFEFAEPFTARAFTISGGRGTPVGRLMASDDGSSFHTLVSLPGAQLYRQGWVRTFSFPETQAKFFRLELTGAPLGPAETMNQTSPKAASEYVLSELTLHSEPRVHRWEEKAGFRHLFEYESVPTPTVPAELAIHQSDLIDLTLQMDENGNLQWDVPEGDWEILRLGYSLTGAKNRPAMPTGLGYEVDKLSREHTESYIENYLQPIEKSLGSLYGETLNYLLMDSWEAGMQNWTDNMMAEFQQRRGYDPKPYLPALAGRVVESAEVSDRFLLDFRRTLADMFAENHYGVIANYLKKKGLGLYGEASGVSLEILEDALLCKKFTDIPMGEFWVHALHPELMYYQDVRGAASAAHVYGKNIVAAEAFTGGGYESPFTLKKVADYWFCQGINRLVFHTSAHQPIGTKPGNTMVGTHLHRNITWAEQAKPFMDYVSRTSFMLQQGQFTADILYLLNEGAPSTMPIWGDGLQPKPPEGYDYDYINVDALLNRLAVNDDGDLVLQDGMTYQILVLPTINRMTLPVIEKISELVENGATIVGPKPLASPSLTDYPQSDEKVRKIANNIWGDLDGISRTQRFSGKGTIYWGVQLSDVLADMHIPKDVENSKPLDSNLYWIHRRINDKDIYFIVNSSDEAQDVDIRFRVSGKTPELWFPDTGQSAPVKFVESGNVTTISLTMPAYASTFVVFDKDAPIASGRVNDEKITLLTTLDGPWDVLFPGQSGAPDKIQLEHLQSWTKHPDDGVTYFSGTAVYVKTFKVSRDWLKQQHQLILDLGSVLDIAEVTINGQPHGIGWKPPFQFDITKSLKPGKNQIEIRVTNQWTNRLIGDHRPNAEQVLYGSEFIRFFGPPPPLQESGLLGPVTILSIQTN